VLTARGDPQRVVCFGSGWSDLEAGWLDVADREERYPRKSEQILSAWDRFTVSIFRRFSLLRLITLVVAPPVSRRNGRGHHFIFP